MTLVGLLIYFLPGRKKAVVLKIEGEVPIHRQNDPDFKAEDVVIHEGFPIPKSLLGGAAIANLAIACPAAQQNRQDDGAQLGVDGAGVIDQAVEGNGGAGATNPHAPAPAAGGPDDEPCVPYGPFHRKRSTGFKT